MLAGIAIGHQFGVEAGLGQALAQVVAGFRLVFDDQQFHGRLEWDGTGALYRGGRSISPTLQSCNLVVSCLAAAGH
ncbi:hypothetical protein D3C80_1623940 [compost metagenome]